MKSCAVFLQGWASHPEVWACQKADLSVEQVIRADYHKGVTDPQTRNGTSLYAVAALEAVNRETEKDQEVVLIGWSLGAMVVLELGLYIPEKIKGIILVGGTGRFTQAPDYQHGLPRAVVERLKKRLTRNPEQTLREFYALMFTPEEREAGYEEHFNKGILSGGMNWSGEELEAGLDFLINQDLRHRLAALKVPSLILHGEKDEICPSSAGLYLKENLRNSQFKLLQGCGHVPFLTQSKVFNKIVKGWITDLDKQRKG